MKGYRDSSSASVTAASLRDYAPAMTPGESIESVVARINKTLGDGTIIPGALLKEYQVPRVTSGSLALDLALGGGWPMNCWVEILGEPSHGKSVIALKTIAANQAIHKDFHTLWIASEPFIPEWAETCGVDVSRVHVVPGPVMEAAYEIVVQWLDNRLCDAVVIDSLSMLVPTEEDEKTMEEWQVGLGARLTGKFMRKSNTAMRRSLTDPDRNCLGIIISQWREKVGVMYGDNRVSPYGRAKEFMFTVRLEVRRDEFIGTDKHRVGQVFKMRTLKNKTAPPQRPATLDFYWQQHGHHRAGAYDIGKQLANIGIDLGLVEVKGGWHYFAGQRWQGKEKFWEAVDGDDLLQRGLAREIKLMSGMGIVIEAPAPAKKRTIKRA